MAGFSFQGKGRQASSTGTGYWPTCPRKLRRTRASKKYPAREARLAIFLESEKEIMRVAAPSPSRVSLRWLAAHLGVHQSESPPGLTQFAGAYYARRYWGTFSSGPPTVRVNREISLIFPENAPGRAGLGADSPSLSLIGEANPDNS